MTGHTLNPDLNQPLGSGALLPLAGAPAWCRREHRLPFRRSPRTRSLPASVSPFPGRTGWTGDRLDSPSPSDRNGSVSSPAADQPSPEFHFHSVLSWWNRRNLPEMDVSVSTAMFLMVLGSVSADPERQNVSSTKAISAGEGQDVSLDCRAPDSSEILVVTWTRPDLNEKGHVFSYGDGHIDLSHQLPSYRNRVELKDRTMGDGDVTLVLKDVRLSDSGTYECFIKQRGTGTSGDRRDHRDHRDHRDRNETIRLFNLSVSSSGGIIGGTTTPPPDPPSGEPVGLTVGLAVAGVLVLVLVPVGVLMDRKRRNQNPCSSPGPDPGREIELTQLDPQRQTEGEGPSDPLLNTQRVKVDFGTPSPPEPEQERGGTGPGPGPDRTGTGPGPGRGGDGVFSSGTGVDSGSGSSSRVATLWR